MAKIWPVYEGTEPTVGGPWAEMPFADAIELFELRPANLWSDPATKPRFGDKDRRLWFAGFKHLVVEVGPSEARRAQWKPGFYVSPIKPDDAFRRLIWHAVVGELGRQNVVRVDSAPATDSQGRDALKLTIVIAPNAIRNLGKDAALNTIIQVQKQLRQMHDERTPIVEYATEAELIGDAGP